MLLRTLLAVLALAVAAIAWTQSASLAASIGVMVFPAEGQDETQQSIDEAQCYNWAVDRSGSDPVQLARQAQEQQAAADQIVAAPGG